MGDDVHFQNGQILVGDVLERLKDIPDETVDTVSTSPPYWGLRDYGVKGQLGLEPDFRDYLKKLYQIMDELKRVLKSTGTCWINLGDSYGSYKGYDSLNPSFIERKPVKSFEKSRMGIPERFYIHCIDDGWIARNHIPWYKANSMPSSIKDRFTNKWESIFFFAKEKKYYFDLDAVRIPTLTDSKPFNIRVRENITGLAQMKLGDKAWTATDEEMDKYNKDGTLKKQNSVVMGNGRIDPTKKNFNKRYKESKYMESMSQQYARAPDRIKQKRLEGVDHEVGLGNVGQGKNPGDVFFINPRPFPDAHFATFPPELPEKILKCACPEGGTILDPFFGSGTVGLVAEQNNRKWIGIELNKEYVEMATKRLMPYNSLRITDFL